MKAIDIVLPPAKTRLEEWERWKNLVFTQNRVQFGKKIEVK